MNPAARVRAAALVATVVLLASCSAGEEPTTAPSESTTTSTTASAEPATEPSEAAGATTEQWASRIAEGKRGVIESVESYDSAGCLPSDEEVTCDAYLMTMQMSAATMALQIEAGLNEDAPGFIGAPPAEIAPLVTDTQEAARAAQQAGQEAVDCTEACEGPVFQFTVAYDRLVTTIDTWSPYGA